MVTITTTTTKDDDDDYDDDDDDYDDDDGRRQKTTHRSFPCPDSPLPVWRCPLARGEPTKSFFIQ